MTSSSVGIQACLWLFFFFSSRRRHTRFDCDWSSDVCSSDLPSGDIHWPFLLVAAGRAGRAVNVKKGQWMSPEGMRGAVEKLQAGGAPEVARSEEGRVGEEGRSRWGADH